LSQLSLEAMVHAADVLLDHGVDDLELALVELYPAGCAVHSSLLENRATRCRAIDMCGVAQAWPLRGRCGAIGWQSISCVATSTLLMMNLMDLRNEEVVALPVALVLLRVGQEVVVLKDELGELLVHLSLLLTLHVGEGVRNDGDQEVEHDHDEEEGGQCEHEVNDG